MAELYFQYEKVPYLFDTRLLKLFRIENEKLIEIKNQETLQKVRFNSIEIDRKKALWRNHQNQK
jgi:hypothetical protein